jgi:hypothetical protein
MKTVMTIAALTALLGAAQPQNADRFVIVDPLQERRDPAVQLNSSPPRCWTRPTLALVILDGAAKAADSFATRENIGHGGIEHDPLARPFVHTTSVQVAATAALFGAEVVTASLLHRRRHPIAARGVLAGGAGMNALGAAFSFKNRAAHW